MLLNAPNPLPNDTIITPLVIHDMLFPIHIGCVHGIINEDNFVDTETQKENAKYIENIIDLPAKGKLFEGRWLDFSGSGDNKSTKNVRHNDFYYRAVKLFDDLDLSWDESNDETRGKIWWRIYRASTSNYYFELGKFSSPSLSSWTTIASTTAFSTIGVYTISAISPYTMHGLVTIRSIPSISVGSYLWCDYTTPINLTSHIDFRNGTPTSSYAMRFFDRFCSIANCINQKIHYVRDAAIQITYTKDTLSSIGQNLPDNDSDKKYYPYREINANVTRYLSQGESYYSVLFRNVMNTPITKKMAREMYRSNNLGARYVAYKALSPAFYIANKVRVPKPYGTRFVSLDTRGEIKGRLANDSLIGVKFQVYVSHETDDDVEVTVHTWFDHDSVIGKDDYYYFLGKVELLFEGMA